MSALVLFSLNFSHLVFSSTRNVLYVLAYQENVVHKLQLYQGADKSLAQPGRKQVRKHARRARDFSNIETQAVIKFFFFQGKAPKEIHAILTETLECFLPGLSKDLSAPLYN